MSGAIVMLSGGRDSTTCLFWAKKHFKDVLALSFYYGQKHHRELESARIVAEKAGVQHQVIDIQTSLLQGTSHLLPNPLDPNKFQTPDKLGSSIQPTFIPCRNILFLVIAANRAVCMGYGSVVIGAHLDDSPGYPDCTVRFITDMEMALNSGLFGNGQVPKLQIHCPIITKRGPEIVRMAQELGAMEAMAYTHTCYNGQFPPCGQCNACIMRQRGFEAVGIEDPLVTRAKAEGLLAS